ncbi:MAG TPA: TspO/MBR family protein [Mycobacterium sp.]|nr:TspO/MBR family protein [Mycobacterium sp.]
MRFSTLLTTATATAATALTGGFANQKSIDTWYRTLDKPGYVPPDAVFPIAWTALYADIAATAADALDRLDGAERRRYVTALGVNLVLNAGWSWLFFGWRRLGLSALAAAVLAASSADLARRTARVSRRSGVALVPYPAWCTFATVMSADIWRRNRDR